MRTGKHFVLCFSLVGATVMATAHADTPPPSANPKANALFDEAQGYLTKSDPRTGGSFANGRQAIKLYSEAVKADPKLARAYVGMARAWLTLSYSNPGGASDAETMPPMRAALRKAIEIAPDLAEAHQLSAAVAYNLDYDWPTAEREYQRVLELAPDNASAHVSYASYLGTVGRFDEALEQAKQADAIAPSAMGDFTFARIYYGMHRYDDAIAWCQKSLAKQPNLATQFYLGLMYVAQNRFDKAMPELVATTAEKNGGALAGLAYAYAMQGENAKALELLDRLYANRESGEIVSYRIAAVYLALNDKPQAMAWLNRSYERHENWMAQLKVDPVMDPLRTDPAFQNLMKKMKFA